MRFSAWLLCGTAAIMGCKEPAKSETTNVGTDSREKPAASAPGTERERVGGRYGDVAESADRGSRIPGNPTLRDSEITQEIYKMFAQNPSVPSSAPAVDVHSQDGVVTLAGSVPSDDDRAAIEREVRKLPGVTKIVNQLQVGAAESP